MVRPKKRRQYEYTSIGVDRKDTGDYVFVRRRGKGHLRGFGQATAEAWAQAHRYCATYDAAVRAAQEMEEGERASTLRLVFGSTLGAEGIENVLDEVGD